MKKIFIVILVFFVLTVPVRAAPEIDTAPLDSTLESVEHYSFCGTFEEIYRAIVENRFSFDGKSITENLLTIFFGGIKESISQIFVLLGICIVLAMAENLKILSPKTESIALMGGKLIFACALAGSTVQFAQNAKDALEGISKFTQALMPVIASLLACTGAQGSVSMLSPASSLLSSMLVKISVDIIMPLIIFGSVTAFADAILDNGKLSGISGLFKSAASFLLGGVFTVFSAVIGIQGAASGAIDRASVRGIKYVLSSSVPIIGGTVSESLSMVLTSGNLIKSAAGIAGIISIAGIIAMPIINICAYILALKLLSACAGTFSGKGIASQISVACDFLKLMVILLFGVGILWFVYLGIIIGAGNSLI